MLVFMFGLGLENGVPGTSKSYCMSFLPKSPLTTVRSRFSADKLQIVRGEAEDTIVLRPHLSNF